MVDNRGFEMSAVIEFTIFPTDHGDSKSVYVARVIDIIKQSGIDYIFTPIETTIPNYTI